MFERLIEKFILMQLMKLEELSKQLVISDNISPINQAKNDLENREVIHSMLRIEWILTICKRIVK